MTMTMEINMISEIGLPKKPGTYFVLFKNGDVDVLNFEYVPYDLNRPFEGNDDRLGFVDKSFDEWGEFNGMIEVTDEIVAWGKIPKLPA